MPFERVDSRHSVAPVHHEGDRVVRTGWVAHTVLNALQEVRAADTAGMQVVFSDCPVNPERDAGGYRSMRSLKELTTRLHAT